MGTSENHLIPFFKWRKIKPASADRDEGIKKQVFSSTLAWIFHVLKIILVILFCINILCLFLALLSPFYNPKYVWVPALFGLFFKPFIAVHFIFIALFLLSRMKRLLLFSLCVLIFALPPLMHTFGIHFWKNRNEGKEQFKLLTYNVNNFRFYKDTISIFEIMQTIKKQNPDIICFQEYLMKPSKRNVVVSKLNKLGYNYFYEYTTKIIKPHNNVGQAIFSKTPFYNIRPISFYNTSNGAFSVDLPIGSDTIRLFNVHFQSISLTGDTIKIPKSVEDVEDPDDVYYQSVLMKLREAFRKRSFQVLKVKEYIDNSPYKVIVSGDFNDTPCSFLYYQLTEKLNDSYIQSNVGLGSTFAGKIPLQRIDYVLTDPSFEIGITRVIHDPGSDHYPVVSTFSLP